MVKTKESKLITEEEIVTFTTKKGVTINKRVAKITRRNGKDITYKDTKKMYQKYLDEGVDPHKMYIRVMAHIPLTIKSLNEDDLKDWESEEYFANRVDDLTEVLDHFQYVQIVIIE